MPTLSESKIKIDLTEFVISVDGDNLLSSLVARKTKVRINSKEVRLAKSADLYSSYIEYIITDENDKIIQTKLLTEQEIERYQCEPYTITPDYITKRVYGKFAITIDVTSCSDIDEPTPARQKPCGAPECACS